MLISPLKFPPVNEELRLLQFFINTPNVAKSRSIHEICSKLPDLINPYEAIIKLNFSGVTISPTNQYGVNRYSLKTPISVAVLKYFELNTKNYV